MDSNSRVAFLQLEHRNEILLHASSATFLLVGHPAARIRDGNVRLFLTLGAGFVFNEVFVSLPSSLQFKVYAVPAGDFSMDYVQPKALCVSVHGRFTEDRYVSVWVQVQALLHE